MKTFIVGLFIAALFFLTGGAGEVSAWGTGGCFDAPGLHIHRDMALRVIDSPDINWALWWFDLDAESIAYYAATEPQCHVGYHPSWTHLRDLAHLNWGWPSDMLVGVILHTASDAGVGACHCPACEVWCHDWAEILFEGTAEARSVPSLTGALTGSYSARMQHFRNVQKSLTSSFKRWFKRTWYCRIYCDPWHWSRQGEINGMRLAHTALLSYFCEYADWAADECDQLFE